MLEFALPRRVARPLWELYVRVGLPMAGRAISPGWHEVGRFLGPSIRDFWERIPERRLLELWSEAGIGGARARRLSLGGGIVVWGTKRSVRPAFYALRPGGWRDYVTLLHPPYTAWHLSYVVVGGCLAPSVPWGGSA